MSRVLLFAQLIVIILLTALHITSIENDLYWRFLWLDNVSHVLGGLWASLCILWILSLRGLSPAVVWGIIGAIVLGVSWEIFEVAAGLPREANYAFDTMLDLFADVGGGVLGAFFVHVYMKSSQSSS